MNRRLGCVALTLFIAPPLFSQNGILCLKDGRMLEDVNLEQVDDGVTIHFKNGDIKVPKELVLTVLQEGQDAAAFVPRTDKEKEMFAKGKVPWKGRYISTKTYQKVIQRELKKRRAMIAEMKDLQFWRNRKKEKSKNFSFEYTVPPEIFDYYEGLMEAYFKDFAKKWKIRTPSSSNRLLVCFYSKRKEFMRTGGAGGGVLGYFRFVKPMELNIYYDRMDARLTETVMYHEANHYLQKLIDMGFSYPHFPGEAIAEYYGASIYDPKKKKIETGLVQEGRLAGIDTARARGEPLGLEKMVSTDQMYEHYSWGWSLVHYLMNEKKYEKKFTAFVLALAKGKDVKRVPMNMDNLQTVRGAEVWRVFKDHMGLDSKEDVDALEKAWYAHIDKLVENLSATGIEKAAFAAASSNPSRDIRARRLFGEAIEAGCTNPLAYHRYAKLLREDSQHDKAVEMIDKAIELDPLFSEFYLEKARILRRKGDKEEMRKLTGLALEIDPDNGDIKDDVEDLLEGV